MEPREEKRNGRQALGRGLGSLLPSASERRRGVVVLGIDQIEPDPEQPRRHFDQAELRGLADSIRAEGILQPVLVRHHSGCYRLIAGERRWRAAQLAGLHELPAIIRDATEQQAFELALIENIQRADLNPLDEAEAYRRLIDEHHLTQDALADRLGKDRSTIANTLRLLRLPTDLKAHLLAGTLSMGHARSLLSLTEEADLKRAAATVLKEDLSVRATEALVRRLRANRERPPPKRESPQVAAIVDRLQRHLGASVRLRDFGGEGQIEIPYASYLDLDRLIELLCYRVK